jgi:hypothetical protein
MAVMKGITWEITVGTKPNPDRFDGFEQKETYRVFADTHDGAVAILKKFLPKLNVDNIIKSERSGISVIVDFPDREQVR